MSLARRINNFNKNLRFTGKLPPGIHIMNPFMENPDTLKVSSRFYNKFYGDNKSRKLIMGINPGRFGAGVTGIPFTDTKRLEEKCGISWHSSPTHETSSVFVYDLIDAYGGVNIFYDEFFINSVSPLGFIIRDKKGKEKNYNYYDNNKLLTAVEPFIIRSIKELLELGMRHETCYCLGKNKNFKYLQNLNSREKFFGEIIALEHPRFIMQYRLKKKEEYINKYIKYLKDYSGVNQ